MPVKAKWLNADQLDGYTATDFATADHAHTGTYAAARRNHDGAYAATDHGHDGELPWAGCVQPCRGPMRAPPTCTRQMVAQHPVYHGVCTAGAQCGAGWF